MPPDLSGNIGDLTKLFSFYEEKLSGIGGQIVELECKMIDGANAIIFLIKVPQESSGVMYIVAFPIPYKTFSFVVKAQCQECGDAGIKEAILLNRILKNGSATGTPYLDAPEYDEGFSNHPVARARKISKNIAMGLNISDDIKKHEPFWKERS